jgi:hypothetical protein
MIRLTVEIREGVLTHRTTVTASSIERPWSTPHLTYRNRGTVVFDTRGQGRPVQQDSRLWLLVLLLAACLLLATLLQRPPIRLSLSADERRIDDRATSQRTASR